MHDLRQFTHDRHRTVDDRPFGGGEGMVLKPETSGAEAVEHLLKIAPQSERAAYQGKPVILLSAQEKRFPRRSLVSWLNTRPGSAAVRAI